jgi:hypothetical protein
MTFEYLPGMKNSVAHDLSHLEIDELKTPKEGALTILSESKHRNIKFPMYTDLIFKKHIKVSGLRDKGLSQPYYYMQDIKGCELLSYEDKNLCLSAIKKKSNILVS